jgi:RNA polymerase sigma factor (sigma-70 family)
MPSSPDARLPSRVRLAQLVAWAQEQPDVGPAAPSAQSAIDCLLREIEPFLLAYFTRTVGPSEARDLLQMVLMRLVELIRARRLRPEHVAGLIPTMAQNLARDWYRADDRLAAHEVLYHDMSSFPDQAQPDRDFEERELARGVLATCDREKVSERDRQILLLLADGFDARAIAAQLNVTDRTIRRVRTRLRKMLRPLLKSSQGEQQTDDRSPSPETPSQGACCEGHRG